MSTGKNIPIKIAKDIATEFGYAQVIIHAYDNITHIQHVTTYGKSEHDCDNAAAGGNAIKKLLNWPEDQCNTKPKRQIKRERFNKMETIVSHLNKVNSVDNWDIVEEVLKLVKEL